MHEICLTLNLNQDIDKFMPSAEPIPEKVHAHLVIESAKKIELKVYHDYKSHLQRKMEVFTSVNKDPLRYANLISVESVNNEDRLIDVDFSNSKFKSFQTSSGFQDNIGDYILIGFDQIKLVYLPTERDEENGDSYEAAFYLNDNSKNFIKGKYSFQGFTWKDPNIWRANNRQKEYLKFGEIEFLLDFNFFTKTGEDDIISIIKEPRLNIRHKNLGEQCIRKYADLICSILSFYMNISVYYFFSRIHTEKQTIIWRKIAKEEIVTNWSRFIKLEFREKFEGLVAKADAKVLKSSRFFNKVVERYNLAKNLDGEARFMVLYNIIEQIRIFYIQEDEVQQTYNFSVSKKKANKIIRENLLNISNIVIPEQRKEFEEHVINHIRTIKYLPMRKQIDALFSHLVINLESLDLDFKKLLSLRNQIFHGISIDTEHEELKKANKELPKVVALLVFNLLSIREHNQLYK